MCLVCALLSLSRTENATKRKRKKNREEGIFVRHPTTAMAAGERYLFFQINRLHPCLFLLALFFSYVCMLSVFLSLSLSLLYSTTMITTIMVIHLTGKRCFLRSTYKSVLQRYVRKCRSLQKKNKEKKKNKKNDDLINKK